jgi:hypothetical protein
LVIKAIAFPIYAECARSLKYSKIWFERAPLINFSRAIAFCVIHKFSRNAPILSGKNQSAPKDFACSATNAIALYFSSNQGDRSRPSKRLSGRVR